MADNKNRTLIWIPKNANYVEILGYKIDGFESFDAFCEHLKKYTELEETVERQKAEIDRLQTELGIKDLEYSLLERERAQDICEFAEELERMNETFNLECTDCQYYCNGICIHPKSMYCEHCELWTPKENDND